MRIKKLMVAFVVAALIAVSVVGPASAQNNAIQDGLVNVSVGNVNVLRDVNIAVAADVVAQACGIPVTVVAGIIADIDAGDVRPTTFCRTDTGPVRVRQN